MAAASHELFEALLASSIDPVLLTRADGAVLRANPAACAALGRSEADIKTLGRDGLVVPTPELDALLQARESADSIRGHVVFRRADGTTFTSELSSTVVARGDGSPVTLVIFRDVTERLRLERELKDSEARFRAAFQTLPDAVTLTDLAAGRFIAVNEGATRVTGWPEAEMLGRPSTELGLWSDGDRAEFIARLKAEGAIRDWRTHLRRKDGSVIDVLLSARPLAVEGRSLMLTVTRDLSSQVSAERARDELQAQLLQSQKMEAIGRLAGGVAHDFNNQLTVILSCAEVLIEEHGPSEELDDVITAGQHAAGLTRQLLAFARKQVFEPARVDLGELLGRSHKFLSRVLGEDVGLETRAPADLWPITADPVQLEQVVMNLAVNARDAMPRGGRLALEAKNVTLDETGAAPFIGARPGDYVSFTVRDTGVGMTRPVMERAFEPFFTTKQAGKGTGLGLAMVHGIVSQSGGFVRIESEPGCGTCFELLFPRERAAATTTGELPRPRVGGNETILLVEDEPRVREVVAHALRRAGYRVLVAPDAATARALAANERPTLVLSDVVMPTVRGPDLVAELRGARPELKALLMSGYPDSLLDDLVPLISKPFTPTALLARVREVLDAG